MGRSAGPLRASHPGAHAAQREATRTRVHDTRIAELPEWLADVLDGQPLARPGRPPRRCIQVAGLDGGRITVVTRQGQQDRGWWSVRVELLGGGPSGDLWPRPGRVFAVSSTHTFHTFAEAIDDAFARWDRSHLHEFSLPKLNKTVTEFRYTDDVDQARELDADALALGELLDPGDEFGYIFDLGDNWRHHCVVDGNEIDPEKVLGVVPERPLPYWGWGVIPDAYGRLFDGDDGETPIPDPPHEPWPWANAPEPTITTQHCPGQYTRIISLGVNPDEDI